MCCCLRTCRTNFFIGQKITTKTEKAAYLNVCDFKQRLLLAAPFTITKNSKITVRTRPFHAYLATLLRLPIFHAFLRKGVQTLVIKAEFLSGQYIEKWNNP
jgi:hypothetical protein